MAQVPDYTFDKARLDALAGLTILDTAPEEGFDSIVELATLLCACPVALVSLVDRDRQWFKARVNFPPCETDLSRSVCAHVLTSHDILVIPDLTADPRTADNPLVVGEPFIRFYAGAPLITAEGHVLGSLCVIDKVPRPKGLSRGQAAGLKALARQVMTQLALRRAVDAELVAQSVIRAKDVYWRGLFDRLTEGFIVGEVVRDSRRQITDWRYVEVNPAWGELVGIDPAAVIGRTVREIIPEVEEAWVSEFAHVVETGQPAQFTRRVGAFRRSYEGRAFKLEADRFGVIFLEVTERVETEARRAALLEIVDRLRDLTTVPQITRVAAEIVGRTLAADRAGFGRIEGDVEHVEIEPDWTAPGMVSIAGRHRFDDYGDIRGHLRRGEALVIDDVRTDPRTRDNPASMLAIGIGALVNVPVRERGRTVAVFIVHAREPRVWNADELAFLRNVADRLEAGVARIHAVEQQALLNGELAHRMKNTMAMVQAIAIQTLRDVSEKEAVAAFTDRVHALAAANDVLMQASWTEADIGQVIGASLGSFRQLDRFDRDGPAIQLGPRAVLSLSLLLHELTTNAIKYGALSVGDGRIGLTWRVDGERDGAELVLSWRERGGPPAREPSRRGFGSRLIRMGLTGSGGAKLDYGPLGLDVELRAPLAHVGGS